jgi:hypothetical protein
VSSKNKSTEVLSSMQYFFKIRSFSQSWRVSPLGAEIAYPSEAHQVYSGALVPRLCVMFCRSLFVLFSVHCVVCFFSIYGFWLPLWYLRFTASNCLFGILDLRLLIVPLVSFANCVVCPSLIYGFWMPLWYLQTFLTQLLYFNVTNTI